MGRVIFQNKILVLLLQEKNNLALKGVKITCPVNNRKNILAHYKGKASMLFDFCKMSLASSAPRPPLHII